VLLLIIIILSALGTGSTVLMPSSRWALRWAERNLSEYLSVMDAPSMSQKNINIKQEQDVMKLKYTLNIPFPEARKQIRNQLHTVIKRTAQVETEIDFTFLPSALPKLTTSTKTTTCLPSTSQLTRAPSASYNRPSPPTSHNHAPPGRTSQVR